MDPVPAGTTTTMTTTTTTTLSLPHAALKPPMEVKMPPDTPSPNIAPFSWSSKKLIQTITIKIEGLDLTSTLTEIHDMATDILTSASTRLKTLLKTDTLPQRVSAQWLAYLREAYDLKESMLNYLAFEYIFYKNTDSSYNVTCQKLDQIVVALQKQASFNLFLNSNRAQARAYVKISPLTFPEPPKVIRKIDIHHDTQLLKILMVIRELDLAYTDALEEQTLDELSLASGTFAATLYKDPPFLQWCAVIHQDVFYKLAAISE